MADHAHTEYATHDEINGFGQRVDGLNERVAVTETKTKRSEEDIQDIFTLTGRNAEAVGKFQTATATRFGELSTLVAESVGGIDKKVSNLKWWIIGGMGAGTFTIGIVIKLWP